MPDEFKVEKWFYRDGKSGAENGPLDFVELAGLLRAGDITSDTPTKTKDDPTWKPFQERREFAWARDMPPGVIMKHLEIKGQKPESPFTPRRIKYLFLLIGGIAVYFLGLLLWPFIFGLPQIKHGQTTTNGWLVWLLEFLIGHKH